MMYLKSLPQVTLVRMFGFEAWGSKNAFFNIESEFRYLDESEALMATNNAIVMLFRRKEGF